MDGIMLISCFFTLVRKGIKYVYIVLRSLYTDTTASILLGCKLMLLNLFRLKGLLVRLKTPLGTWQILVASSLLTVEQS